MDNGAGGADRTAEWRRGMDLDRVLGALLASYGSTHGRKSSAGPMPPPPAENIIEEASENCPPCVDRKEALFPLYKHYYTLSIQMLESAVTWSRNKYENTA